MEPSRSKEFLDIQAKYRVWIHSETSTWHDKSIELKLNLWSLPKPNCLQHNVVTTLCWGRNVMQLIRNIATISIPQRHNYNVAPTWPQRCTEKSIRNIPLTLQWLLSYIIEIATSVSQCLLNVDTPMSNLELLIVG